MQFPHGHAAVTSRAHFIIATGEPGRRNAAMTLKSEDLPAAYDLHMVTNDGLV